MASFDRTFSSPIIALPPQLPPQPFMTSTHRKPLFANHSPFGRKSPQSESWSHLQPQASSFSAGRKRSRDEAAENLNDDFASLPLAITPTAPESEEDWVYGEGMTLVKPNGFIIDASSQTGTWIEEKVEEAKPVVQLPVSAEPSVLRCHKSQRLDLSAIPNITDEVCLSNGLTVASSPPKTASMEPTVDDFTIHLGIGWSRISDDEDLQAAARGWARYIENHYPVSDTTIRLQSKGLASYLVEAQEGYFLFGEDLKQGRLVSTSLVKTFDNLKNTPPVFDGSSIMIAAGSPVSEQNTQSGEINGTDESFQVIGPAGQELGFEMDMS